MKNLNVAVFIFALMTSSVFAKDVVTCTINGRLLTDNSPTIYTAKIKLVNKKMIFEATDAKKISSACELKGEKIELQVDKKNPKYFQFVALLKVEGQKIKLPILWSDSTGLNIAFGACDSKSVVEINNIYEDEVLKCSAFNTSSVPHKKIDFEKE